MCGLDWGFTTCWIKDGTFMVEHATLKVASNKMAEHEKECSDNQHVFIPFVFDIFGFLPLEVLDLLHRV